MTTTPSEPAAARETATREAAAALTGVETAARPAAPAVEPATGITGAQSLVRSLEAVGVDVIFGIPGATSWSATSRAPGTRPPATRRRPAGSVSAWPPPVRGRPTW